MENGIAGDDLGTLVHDRKLNAVVLKELQAAGRRGGLSGIEIVEGVVMADEEWTPQNVRLNFFLLSLFYYKTISAEYNFLLHTYVCHLFVPLGCILWKIICFRMNLYLLRQSKSDLLLSLSPQNLVTAAQKLNRKGILQRYKKEVDEAYAKGSA